MSELQQFIYDYCTDVNDPASVGDVVADMHFLKVKLRRHYEPGWTKPFEATPESFKQMMKAHEGAFVDHLDLLDGKEHSYIEVGGWIGDQGDAMRFMGMGVLLGLFDLLTPQTMLGDHIPKEMKDELAGRGMVCIIKKKEKVKVDVDRYRVRVYRVLRVEEEAFLDVEVAKGTSEEKVNDIVNEMEVSDDAWKHKESSTEDFHVCKAVKQ